MSSKGMFNSLQGVLQSIPIFLKNPDGSMAEGVPPGYTDFIPTEGAPKPYGFMGDRFSQTLDEEQLREEVSYLGNRHMQLFGLLVTFQFLVEVTFEAMYVSQEEMALKEQHYMYANASLGTLKVVFWTTFGIEICFGAVYYCIAGMALFSSRPKHFEFFARCGMIGVFLEIALAYVNRFNLLIFFMRLLAFMYARVLKGFMVQLLLLPAPRPAESTRKASFVGQCDCRRGETTGWTEEDQLNQRCRCRKATEYQGRRSPKFTV